MSHTVGEALLSTLVVLGIGGAGQGVFSHLARSEPSWEGAQENGSPRQQAKPPGQEKYLPLAERLWATLEIVEKHHLGPCSRQTMLLDATRAFLKAVDAKPELDLEQSIAKLSSASDYAALLANQVAAANARVTLPSEKLEAALIEGLVKSLPGAAGNVLPPLNLKIAEQLAGNRYVGIGIQLHANKEAGRPQILNPFTNGPAFKGGVRPDDMLIEVDGKDTKDVPLQKVIDWLRGEEGTKVTIAVGRPGAAEKRTVRLVRAKVSMPTVLGFRRSAEDRWDYRIDPAVAYVWVRSINSSTLHELRLIERELRAQGVKALVLDFRHSAGQGHLHHAELVAGAILDGEVMWRTRDAAKQAREYRAEQEGVFRGMPLAALINGEISDNAQGALLAALQDTGRAVLVGEPTKCDGHIKSIFPLPEGQGGLIIRTARFERTSGQPWPVKPDQAVPLSDQGRGVVHQWLKQKEMPLIAGSDKAPEDAQLARARQLLQEKLANQAAPRK